MTMDFSFYKLKSIFYYGEKNKTVFRFKSISMSAFCFLSIHKKLRSPVAKFI